ncbi:MAG: site-specific recombinase [Deltaproteobacteria bacterium]|nr:site-specific recombinase [Deltaproteobacteria bacterium]
MPATETLEVLLREFAMAPSEDSALEPTVALTRLVADIRPRRAKDLETASRAVQALAHTLAKRPELRSGVRSAVLSLIESRRGVSLFTESGMFPNRGFFDELLRRFSHTLLPETVDPGALKDAFGLAFDRTTDATWVLGVPDETLADLVITLDFDELPGAPLSRLFVDVLEALRILSYRVAAIGLEPELLRVAPDLDQPESPFLAQSLAALDYLDRCRSSDQLRLTPPSSSALREVLERCLVAASRVRAKAAEQGTSLSLTLHLQRIRQHVARSLAILDVLDGLAPRGSVADAAPALVRLVKRLAADECRKNSVPDYLRANLEILARRVTDNAGRTGEHYITSSRPEYFAMFRSAALAGFVIAFMALAKLLISKQHLPPLTSALAVCLNYGLGFVLIHLIHGTVATKQPAMTAAAIASSIGESYGDDPAHGFDKLAALIARTCRSQLVAILGNVGVAVPLSILLGLAISSLTGAPYPAPEKARALLDDLHPFESGSILFAGIAGVCLFLSGLISGFYDNLAAYDRIPQRLEALPLVRKLLGPKRAGALAGYVRTDLGALAGNFFFGFLLGGVSAAGSLFGLPLDIRHVTFASAHIGFGAQALGFVVSIADAYALLGVVLIGFVNLAVSFALSLWIALRSRRVPPRQSGPLLMALFRLLRRSPRDFFFPPKEAPPEADLDAAAGPRANSPS